MRKKTLAILIMTLTGAVLLSTACLEQRAEKTQPTPTSPPEITLPPAEAVYGGGGQIAKETLPPTTLPPTTMPPVTSPPETTPSQTTTTTPPPTTFPPAPTLPAKDFKTPLPIDTTEVTIQNGPTKITGYLAKPSKRGQFPGILILHGTEGYQEHHKEYTRNLAENGYTALAICWFGCPGGRNNLEDIELGDLQATTQYLETHENVDEKRLAVIGYSRGASLALLTGSSIPQYKAVVDYYGPAVISDSFQKIIQANPTGNKYGFKNLNGPVLILHGEDDQTVPVRAAYSIEKQLKEANKEYEIKIYPGVGHAYNWDDRMNYNPQATQDSWERVLNFLDKNLWIE